MKLKFLDLEHVVQTVPPRKPASPMYPNGHRRAMTCAIPKFIRRFQLQMLGASPARLLRLSNYKFRPLGSHS